MTAPYSKVIENNITPISSNTELVKRLMRESKLKQIPLSKNHLLFFATHNSFLLFSCLLEKHDKSFRRDDYGVGITTYSQRVYTLSATSQPLELFKNKLKNYSLTFGDDKGECLRILTTHKGGNTIYLIGHKDVNHKDFDELASKWGNFNIDDYDKGIINNQQKLVKAIISKGLYIATINNLKDLLRKKKNLKLEKSIGTDDDLIRFLNKLGIKDEALSIKNSIYVMMKILSHHNKSDLSVPSRAEFDIVKKAFLRGLESKKINWSINKEFLNKI